METVIWGCKRFQSNSDDLVVYCSVQKKLNESEADFAILLPEADSDGSDSYRVRIEGNVGANNGKKPDTVLVNFQDDMHFADFYTEDGEIIKQMLSHGDKYYKRDGIDGPYYEVTSANGKPSETSSEELIRKDDEHRYMNAELIAKKEKFANIFLAMFEAVR